jgi:hypothetical protein
MRDNCCEWLIKINSREGRQQFSTICGPRLINHQFYWRYLAFLSAHSQKSGFIQDRA